MEEVIKVISTLDSMSKMNKALLLITKIENGQFTNKTEVNINDLSSSIAEEFSEIYEHKNIQIKIIQESTLIVKMDNTLSHILVVNLIKNAFVHTPENGIIIIDINKHHFSISNTAMGGALSKDQIFTRFYHSSQKENSTGLGLSIVESICKLYDFQCIYNFKNNMHEFKLSI